MEELISYSVRYIFVTYFHNFALIYRKIITTTSVVEFCNFLGLATDRLQKNSSKLIGVNFLATNRLKIFQSVPELYSVTTAATKQYCIHTVPNGTRYHEMPEMLHLRA